MGTGPGRCPDYAHPQSRPLGRAPSGKGGPAPTQCPGLPWAGRLRGKTAGKPGPPCRAFCPGLRDWKMALLRGTVRWPRSVGLQRARASPGAPGPRGPTSRPEGVPGSHHHSHEAGPSKHGLGLSLCSWDGDRARLSRHPRSWGSRSAWRPRTGPESCRQGPRRCPAARANRKGTHHPQNLRDKFRATKRVIGSHV